MFTDKERSKPRLSILLCMNPCDIIMAAKRPYPCTWRSDQQSRPREKTYRKANLNLPCSVNFHRSVGYHLPAPNPIGGDAKSRLVRFHPPHHIICRPQDTGETEDSRSSAVAMRGNWKKIKRRRWYTSPSVGWNVTTYLNLLPSSRLPWWYYYYKI